MLALCHSAVCWELHLPPCLPAGTLLPCSYQVRIAISLPTWPLRSRNEPPKCLTMCPLPIRSVLSVRWHVGTVCPQVLSRVLLPAWILLAETTRWGYRIPLPCWSLLPSWHRKPPRVPSRNVQPAHWWNKHQRLRQVPSRACVHPRRPIRVGSIMHRGILLPRCMPKPLHAAIRLPSRVLLPCSRRCAHSLRFWPLDKHERSEYLRTVPEGLLLHAGPWSPW